MFLNAALMNVTYYFKNIQIYIRINLEQQQKYNGININKINT